MTSAELAQEVAAFIEECQARVMGVGNEQYSMGDKQKFEVMSIDELIEYTEEELRDMAVYACMNHIRLRRLREALAARGLTGHADKLVPVRVAVTQLDISDNPKGMR